MFFVNLNSGRRIPIYLQNPKYADFHQILPKYLRHYFLSGDKCEIPKCSNTTHVSEIMADENIAKKKQDHKNPKRFPNKKHAIKKRLPVRPIEGDNVIYVTKKTNFKAQLDKCCDLLGKGEKEIILHGLGAAIQRCCNLALQLEILFSGTCQIEVNTGTVDVIDDLEPLTDDVDFGAQVRHTSSIHIRIFRTALLGANK